MKKIFLITSMFTVVTIFSCKDNKEKRQEMSLEKKSNESTAKRKIIPTVIGF